MSLKQMFNNSTPHYSISNTNIIDSVAEMKVDTPSSLEALAIH